MNLARRFNAGKAPVGETRFCLSRITGFEKPG